MTIDDLRLAWEPRNGTPMQDIEDRFRAYFQKRTDGVSLLGNGTLLFTPAGRDDLDDAQRAMREAKFLVDFQVNALKEGGLLVTFHKALAVFVGDQEFRDAQLEIQARIGDLSFPGETFFGEQGEPKTNLLVGLYARGKLQYDVHHLSFYKRICGGAS